ncbi:MAG: hypothetical protein HY654_07555, partial [Acidobacteria bacterium]|nr:hypothetical protein [Acidobacteriota bacterium]
QARFEYGADRYGARLDHLYVGDHFNPEVGFVQRDNFRRSFASARFSPRPASIRRVRKFNWEGSLEYILDGSGVLETRVQTARFGTEFESSDLFNVEVRRDYERLIRPFSIARDVSIPVGAYQFTDVQTSYTFGAQRRASGTITLQRGAFYDGTITGVSYTGGRISVTRHLSLEPSLSINDVDLPAGDFTTRVFRIRTDYAFSPRMFSSALLQYSSGDRTFSSNLRFRWEYRPGSELFVVYTDERARLRRAPAYGLRNRAFVVKVNRLFRF